MPASSERQRFRNEDLVLKVTPALDRARWDESRYEAFIDELCGSREYQKEALQTILRYLLGGEYGSLRDLARQNFDSNDVLHARYGSWAGMERHLQLPDQLSASLDLATATGKSYLLYGIGAILLAEGAVDRVLVLCPSTTIEAGLLGKFRDLASNAALRDLLPDNSRISAPQIINASQTITQGSICVENYHAILVHVGSSIRDSLAGRGARVAVLNDEAHHVANDSDARVKRWKEFLTDPAFGFRYIVGVSGTCYVNNEYFADVVYRYSLREAIEQNYVKSVEYVAEMPRTRDPDEKWQLIYNRHEEYRKKLRQRRLRPLTIIVTPKIARCKDVAEELRGFLMDHAGLTPDQADEQVLVVYNNAPDVQKLPHVDNAANKVEWIVSVSMLNEGWDVKRVFQIVPHEERAFNSKLLIAQVLGRGLRIPPNWRGEQPQVTVFNHDAWAPRIRHLVQEILEMEKRITCRVLPDSPHHFDLHNIDYKIVPTSTSIRKPMTGEYTLFDKGYVDLATDSPAEDVSVTLEQAVTGAQRTWRTTIKHKTYKVREIAEAMYHRLEEAQDADDADPRMRTFYTDAWPLRELEKIVRKSLQLRKAEVATESMKQKFLQSLGPLRRRSSEFVRYKFREDRYLIVPTRERPGDSASAAELHRTKTLFYTDQTRGTLVDEQMEFFDQIAEPGSGFKLVAVDNRHDFKTPMNAVIADHDNELRFMRMLVQPENVPHYDAWIKSTTMRFYEIDYAWKKREHPKRAKFSPDVFIKAGNLILVLEIKDDEELSAPLEESEENRKKNRYALKHFERVNEHLAQEGSALRYMFNFITPINFSTFFQQLGSGNIANFRSELDLRLAEDK